MSSPQGLVVLSAPDYAKPWLVTGSGRSGTTGLTLVLAALGLHLLTEGIQPSEHERLSRAYHERDLPWLRDFRREWSAGFLAKVPSLGTEAAGDPELADALDCNYIFSMRDAVAEAFYDTGQHPDAHVGELMRMRARMSEAGVSSAIALSQTTGVLMVSYEKLIQPLSNTELIAHLCTLVGGDPTRVEEAVALVSPEDAGYRARAYSMLTWDRP